MDPTIPFPGTIADRIRAERARSQQQARERTKKKHDVSAMTPEQARALLASVCNAADAKFQEIRRLTDELVEFGVETSDLMLDMERLGHVKLNSAYVTIAGVLLYYQDGASGQPKVMTLPNGSA